MHRFYSAKVVKPMENLPAIDFPFLEDYPRKKDLTYYELGMKDENGPCIQVKVFPEIGAKSTGLWYHGAPIELYGDIWEPYLYLSAPWGSYIPYPTPNRVRDGRFTFRGETVAMEKFGRPRESHGIAYDSVWQYEEPVVAPECVSMRAWLDIRPGDENFPAFPYESRLTVTYRVTEHAMRFSYCVENLGNKPMPYGLCKHPFFMREDASERIEIKVEAEDFYETTPDLLPTGNFLPVSDYPKYDLRWFRSLDDVCMDTVFTHLRGDSVFIRYPRRGYQMRIHMSGEFRNVVVFSMKAYAGIMPDNDLPETFCIESQTCCTDGINMHEKGFKESGLIVLQPGESKDGFVSYEFEEIKEENKACDTRN